MAIDRLQNKSQKLLTLLLVDPLGSKLVRCVEILRRALIQSVSPLATYRPRANSTTRQNPPICNPHSSLL